MKMMLSLNSLEEELNAVHSVIEDHRLKVVELEERLGKVQNELASRYAGKIGLRAGQRWRSCMGRVCEIVDFTFKEQVHTVSPYKVKGQKKEPEYSYKYSELICILKNGDTIEADRFVSKGQMTRIYQAGIDGTYCTDWVLLNDGLLSGFVLRNLLKIKK